MPISQSHLLHLSAGFNALEAQGREFNPDFLAVLCGANGAGSWCRLMNSRICTRAGEEAMVVRELREAVQQRQFLCLEPGLKQRKQTMSKSFIPDQTLQQILQLNFKTNLATNEVIAVHINKPKAVVIAITPTSNINIRLTPTPLLWKM